MLFVSNILGLFQGFSLVMESPGSLLLELTDLLMLFSFPNLNSLSI